MKSKSLFSLVAVVATLLSAHMSSAQSLTGQKDSLTFFKNYFVTGDYAVSGVGLRGTGVNGWATGTIPVSGVPSGGVVVAAFLYWEAIESTTAPSTMNGYFQGYPIVGVSRGTGAPPCWSGGGGTGSSKGSKHLRVYRADVAPYLVVNGQYATNYASPGYQVKLQDSGSNGAGTPLTEGASLVIVYRTLTAPLRSVSFYDGSWTMDNATQYMSQTIDWFYGAAPGTAKITHIVGDGQANFGESMNYYDGINGPQTLAPPTGTVQDPFPGHYNGTWDNATFAVTIPNDPAFPHGYPGPLATEVVPNSSNVPCLSWGAVVFSAPVVNTDQDGLLDIWKVNGGYKDSTGQQVLLPGAALGEKDLFVQIDALQNTDANNGATHYHLPKSNALMAVGSAFINHGIHVHFDVGNNYQANPYVIPAASGAALGGNRIEEDTVECADGAALCDFPYAALQVPGIVSWKSGVTLAKNQYFQHARKDSYHYVLAGHALGLPAETWSIPDGTLVSISVNAAQVATVTTSTPHGLKNGARVSIGGAVGNFNLNGAYNIASASGNTFTVNTTGVTPGTYGNFAALAGGVGYTVTNGLVQSDEPNLVLSAGAPLSISGFSDLGGADTLITLGMWNADDAANCQADPTQALAAGQAYCDNQVGSVTVQAGTLMHEIGHTLYLTHGGFYPATANSPAAFGQNCKPNFLSVMNYLFQIRGLPNNTGFTSTPTIDYSSQTLPNLDETALTDANGLGKFNGALPAFGTVWYGPPSFIDLIAQKTSPRLAQQHCDGTPLDGDPPTVRMTGATVAGGAVAPIDWNNDGVINSAHDQDINFDGFNMDTGLSGFNDWDPSHMYFQQIGSRRNIDGFSADLGANDVGGGGLKLLGGGLRLLGGGADLINGGSQLLGSGLKLLGGGLKLLGGGLKLLGGGLELDFDQANAAVDPPVSVAMTLVSKTQVSLAWMAPTFGQIRTYYVYRATVTKYPMSASNPPTLIGTVKGTPPAGVFTDTTVKSKQTYEYYVTAALGAASGMNNGNQSGPSNFVVVAVP